MSGRAASQPYFDGVQLLDIVKFALSLEKISFHPIFAVLGKHTNFFEASQAASQPFKKHLQSLKISTVGVF